ncbi:DUF2550 domain-containing protein [Cellulomonas fimi]|uniref:Secreted/membrane protein n=1 Tax=Cellulomonas fimi (strain ATCC 484 / DSM 20113 / JCM 1341 / CCUG 24087 / LMG 16345 / NBRC 15513 / NCIMB 8980 / NCTC 7547 / NRS-133) TaxID=590998 RepID=F4H7G0_CELFA|nr:DUF2550 domain-containing protein [Cellulomonas fimi]AEE46921.1 Protein of unknown function DUF2550 [Cellulomonas fimi ATCC 484]NNH07868.1 DUF2550 family protein [Cellulomonas fimi]VEH34571.1 Protein of uncharacterised function (DUF2550) [Cellulomonas fimi]
MSPVVVGLLIGAAALVLAAVLLWVSRVHALERRVGSFRCAVGRSTEGPWSLGVAQYGSQRLYWWRRWSLRPRPSVRWDRAGLSVVERTQGTHPSGAAFVVVTCRCGGGDEVHLMMAPDAYAGLTSWIEATPSRVGSVI